MRYCPELLNFKFEGNRKIDEKTLAYAQKINEISPFINKMYSYISGPEIDENCLNKYYDINQEYIRWESDGYYIKWDDVDDYLTILDLLIDADQIIAIEEKGMYYQYYDESHDNGDYGERYFDQYLEKQPRSVNVLCDKALSQFNKGNVEESLNYMDKAYDKYKSYSAIEKPRI